MSKTRWAYLLLLVIAALALIPLLHERIKWGNYIPGTSPSRTDFTKIDYPSQPRLLNMK